IAQSVELVSPSFAALDSQGWRALHSFCSACCAVVLLRACATLLLGRRTDDPVSNNSHPERESFVAELHHHRALHPVFRRPIYHALPSRSTFDASKHEFTACNRRRRARCHCARAKLAPSAQFVFATSAHERQL